MSPLEQPLASLSLTHVHYVRFLLSECIQLCCFTDQWMPESSRHLFILVRLACAGSASSMYSLCHADLVIEGGGGDPDVRGPASV